jgi:DNA-binding NarL/FixJ family response regulator
MSPDGKVHEARGAARGALLELVDAAKRTERARSRLADDDEKLALCTALHDGQWSFVDTTENDGKRMLLACRNEPTTRPLRDLSRRERSVMEYAALGHSNKYIAYELGLSMASVSSILKRVMSKLGLESRSALIRMFGAGVARLP